MSNQQEQAITELLVIRCQQGDRKAFAALVELWHKPLLGYALRYLEQESEACDAVQETWVAVIRGIDRLRDSSLFVSWMFRILTHKCIDRIQQRLIYVDRLKNAQRPEPPNTSNNDSEKLVRAIEKLSDDHKSIILLRFAQGLVIDQIASILNINTGTVKSRLHRAIANLRQMIGEKS